MLLYQRGNFNPKTSRTPPTKRPPVDWLIFPPGCVEQEINGTLPVTGFFTSTDAGIEAYDIWLQWNLQSGNGTGLSPPGKMFGGSRTVVVGNGVYNDVDYWCLVPSDHLGSTASKRNGKVDHQSRRYSRETVLRRNGTYSIGPMLVACGVTLILRIDFWFCWYSSSHSRFVICTKCPGRSMVNFSTLSSNTATSPYNITLNLTNIQYWHMHVVNQTTLVIQP